MGIKARRYADILAGAPEYVTGRQDEWKAFLTTAARNYKYPYYDQLMIYLQRPKQLPVQNMISGSIPCTGM